MRREEVGTLPQAARKAVLGFSPPVMSYALRYWTDVSGGCTYCCALPIVTPSCRENENSIETQPRKYKTKRNKENHVKTLMRSRHSPVPYRPATKCPLNSTKHGSMVVVFQLRLSTFLTTRAAPTAPQPSRQRQGGLTPRVTVGERSIH